MVLSHPGGGAPENGSPGVHVLARDVFSQTRERRATRHLGARSAPYHHPLPLFFFSSGCPLQLRRVFRPITLAENGLH